jgi:trimeric autotransporter adhesin
MKRLLLLFACCILYATAQCQIITTIAGNGTAGFGGDGAPAISAELNLPSAVAVDSSGNLYIADYFNNRIRKVSPSGSISTVAGTGAAGYSGDNGPATAAELNLPIGVAVDVSGNVYFSDLANNSIRKINSVGIIVTFAGNTSGLAGYSGDGGPASAAKLSFPEGICLDNSGNLYIAESGNSVIRKINTSGMIYTVAGAGIAYFGSDGGMATASYLDNPGSVTIDNSGNIYIADNNSNRVRKVNSAGIISTIAGTGTAGFSGDDGSATLAQLNHPGGLAADKAGNIYFSDVLNGRVRKISSSGIISTVAGGGTSGLGDNGPATAATLNYVVGIAFDKNSNLYIADTHHNRVRYMQSAVSVNTIEATNDVIKIHPNPSTGNFAINIHSDINQPLQICITDILGKKIKSIDGFINSSLDVRLDAPSGIYLMSAIVDNVTHVKRIIVSQ